MANHCSNYASIVGSSDMLDRVERAIEKATEEQESLWWETFKKIFPACKYDFGDDVYAAFGSKWFEPHLERVDKNTLTISGDSAWSPVSEFFRKLSETYNLDIESDYEESGMDFAGYFNCKNGEVTLNIETTYRLYRNEQDPGMLLEMILEDVNDGMFESFEEWESRENPQEKAVLTDSEIELIRNTFENL